MQDYPRPLTEEFVQRRDLPPRKYFDRDGLYLRVIERALRAQGISARQASIEALGNDALVKRMRAGQNPTIDSVASLCEVLNLDFHVGPPPPPPPLDEERLVLAVEAAVRSLKGGQERIVADEFAQKVASVYVALGTRTSS